MSTQSLKDAIRGSRGALYAWLRRYSEDEVREAIMSLIAEVNAEGFESCASLKRLRMSLNPTQTSQAYWRRMWAGQAMQAIYMRKGGSPATNDWESLEHTAECAFLQADAMIRADRGFPKDPEVSNEIMKQDIRVLQLGVRAQNILAIEKIDTVQKLCNLRDLDLKKMWGMGKKSINEIVVALAKRGLKLRGHA